MPDYDSKTWEVVPDIVPEKNQIEERPLPRCFGWYEPDNHVADIRCNDCLLSPECSQKKAGQRKIFDAQIRASRILNPEVWIWNYDIQMERNSRISDGMDKLPAKDVKIHGWM